MNKNLKLALCAAIFPAIVWSCDDDDKGTPPSIEEKPLSQYNTPARNPWLAQETYSITHFNSAQTDAFPYAVKEGTYTVDPDDCPSTWSGPVNLMTLASTSPGYMWGMSSDEIGRAHV